MDEARNGRNGANSGERPEPTREGRAAFEERMDALGDYVDVLEDAQEGEREAWSDELNEARAHGGAGYGAAFARGERRLQTVGLTILLLAIVLIIAYFLFYERGIDVTAQLTGGESSEIDQIAPPEPAATPAEVLPPGVFTSICEDCGDDVTQVALDLNKDAKYQYAYESGGSRIAIFTVVDSSEFDSMKALFDSDQSTAEADGQEIEPPKSLDDVGDEAIVYEAGALFRTGDECGILTGNVLQNGAGEVQNTLSAEELERLARIAAPRM